MPSKTENKKNSFFTKVNAEFKKVVWPTPKEAVKQTVIVILVALMLGVLISYADQGIKWLISLL